MTVNRPVRKAQFLSINYPAINFSVIRGNVLIAVVVYTFHNSDSGVKGFMYEGCLVSLGCSQ